MNAPSPHVLIDQIEHLNEVFRPHGRYEASLVGNLVHSHVFGPVNLEAIQLYSKKIGPLLQHLEPGTQLGWLTVFHDSMIMSPQALAIFTQKVSDIAATGLIVAVAHVAGQQVEGRNMMSRIFSSKILEPAGITYRLFSDIEGAKPWLEQQMSIRTR